MGYLLHFEILKYRITTSQGTDRGFIFLGAFVKLRKATISFIMSVCPSVRQSVRIEQVGFQWADFYEI
jgi:hypothetical protein